MKYIQFASRPGGDSCWWVDVNFSLVDAARIDNAACDFLTRVMDVEGVNNVVIGSRYILTVQIGALFNWEMVFEEIKPLIRWYAQAVEAQDVNEVSQALGQIETAPDPPVKPIGTAEVSIGDSINVHNVVGYPFFHRIEEQRKSEELSALKLKLAQDLGLDDGIG